MSKNLSAHQFKQVYEDLGYDLAKLGCIMMGLDTKRLEKAVTDVISDSDAYHTTHPDRFWINGIVANKAHVTLLYGLLRSGTEMKKHVDTVLDGLTIQPVTIDHVDFFDSPYDDEQYYCIIAHLKISPDLQEAHDRLTFLPHINTFPGYKAHCTLAYIRKDAKRRDEIIKQLNNKLAITGAAFGIKTTGLDYGSTKR